MAQGKREIFFVLETEAMKRLDSLLVERFPAYSRTFFQHHIHAGRVSGNGTPLTKASTRVPCGVKICVDLPETVPPSEITRTAARPYTQQDTHPVSVVFDHEQFAIINKPAGLVVHHAPTLHEENTLVDWMYSSFPETRLFNDRERPGIVHRLDKDTSGLMIIAKTEQATFMFGELFKKRAVYKRYLALVSGTPPATGKIEYHIRRHPVNRLRMTHSTLLGRPSLTQYQVLEYYEGAAYIAAEPHTGRTHQIRVHCAAIGHPLLGDALYGTATPLMSRHALHAAELRFTFEGTDYTFTQEPPADFQQALVTLRNTMQ